MDGTLKLAVQLSRRFSNAVGADDLAVQVGQWLANHDCDNRYGDKHHAIHASVDKVWEDVVNVEDVGNSAVEDCNTSLERCKHSSLAITRKYIPH